MTNPWGFCLGAEGLSLSDADLQRTCQEAKAAGATWMRVVLWWSLAQPTKTGPYDWAQADRHIGAVVAAGLKPLVVVHTIPTWRSGPFGWFTERPTPAHFGAFMTAAAQRYRDRVDSWEIGNEQNQTIFGDIWFDPAVYARFLTAGYDAVKAVTPASWVILGGMFPCGDHPFWPGMSGTRRPSTYLAAVYASGGRFDGVGMHPYVGPAVGDQSPVPTNQSLYVAELDTVRTLMVSRGDGHKLVWATELGWKSTDVGEVNQRDYLGQMWALLDARPWVYPRFIYCLRDTDQVEQGETGFGILRRDWTAKPSAQWCAGLQGV